MSPLNNVLTICLAHGIFQLTSRIQCLGLEHAPRWGQRGLLAVAHLSHYDPVVVSALLGRKVDWIARDEFYHTAMARWWVQQCDCIRIDRTGFALPGIREGVRRVEAGRLVGIFPDGEVMSGDRSVLNGARLKGGAAVIARRTNVPIVPCVVLGCNQFKRFIPWLPIRSGQLWIGLGPPVTVPEGAPAGRATRAAVSAELGEAMRAVYQKMRQRFDIPDEVLP